MDVQVASSDQVKVDGGVEISVILDVVDVAVQIVVPPSRWYGGEVLVVLPLGHRGLRQQSIVAMLMVA